VPKADQEVVLVAVGPDYTTWEGGLDPATGKARIGISYEKLCQSLKPGNVIKVDGAMVTGPRTQRKAGRGLLVFAGAHVVTQGDAS
jgi:hypothetical protein